MQRCRSAGGVRTAAIAGVSSRDFRDSGHRCCNVRVQGADCEAIRRRIHLPTLTQNSAHGWHIEGSWSGKREELAASMHPLTFLYKELLQVRDKKTESPIGQ